MIFVNIFGFSNNHFRNLIKEALIFMKRNRSKCSNVDVQSIRKANNNAKINSAITEALNNLPVPIDLDCAAFVIESDLLNALNNLRWISTDTSLAKSSTLSATGCHTKEAKYAFSLHPIYTCLKAIPDVQAIKKGYLLTRFFPYRIAKPMLLQEGVARFIKAICFNHPSCEPMGSFSSSDRAMMEDLKLSGIRIYWKDPVSQNLLEYIGQDEHSSGIFMPADRLRQVKKFTTVGVYGSNLQSRNIKSILYELLRGLIQMRASCNHNLLNLQRDIRLVTGGGPGVMAVANEVAQNLGVLSCAHVVDFINPQHRVVNEQNQNNFIDAKITYPLKELVHRQGNFQLDLPIFFEGGIGTDFEYSIEEVGRKTGALPITPVILVGKTSYWKQKITHRFRLNMETGSIAGSEWVSNCFFCVQSAEQALSVYRDFFHHKLQIGLEGDVFSDGFRVL